MKLVTFATAGGEQLVGVLEHGRVEELDALDMRTLFERGAVADRTGRTFAREEITLKAPVLPKKFFHTAGNFREHADEGERSGWVLPSKPWIVFFQNVDAIIGPDEAVVYPEHLTEELDDELELAVCSRRAASTSRPTRQWTTSAAT